MEGCKMNKFIKYTSRIVLGLFTLFWGIATLVAFFPDESYHHCEAGQEEWSTWQCVLVFIVSIILFFFVWYKTRKW